MLASSSLPSSLLLSSPSSSPYSPSARSQRPAQEEREKVGVEGGGGRGRKKTSSVPSSLPSLLSFNVTTGVGEMAGILAGF